MFRHRISVKAVLVRLQSTSIVVFRLMIVKIVGVLGNCPWFRFLQPVKYDLQWPHQNAQKHIWLHKAISVSFLIVLKCCNCFVYLPSGSCHRWNLLSLLHLPSQAFLIDIRVLYRIYSYNPIYLCDYGIITPSFAFIIS